MIARAFRQHSRSAFTLVEMLAAIAVLGLLMVIISGLVSTAQMTTSASNRYLEADAEARAVFDRMQMDFAGMVKRPDVGFEFLKQTHNDAFYFYSQAPGVFDSTNVAQQSDLALVGYRINPATVQGPSDQPTTIYQLERLGRGLPWTQVAFTPSAPSVDPNDADFHTFGATVFRLEVAFLLKKDDNTFQITGVAPAPGWAAFQNLWGICVAIAVLDTNDQKITTNFAGLIAAFDDFNDTETLSLTTSGMPDGANVTPIMNSWNATLRSPNFYQVAGVPKAVADHVHIYERTFLLK